MSFNRRPLIDPSRAPMPTIPEVHEPSSPVASGSQLPKKPPSPTWPSQTSGSALSSHLRDLAGAEPPRPTLADKAATAARRVSRHFHDVQTTLLNDVQRAYFANLEDYGATRGELDGFGRKYCGDYVESASAGMKLVDLNDVHGALLFEAHIKAGHDIRFTERLPVVKFAERYYVKGFNDRILSLQTLGQLLDDNKQAPIVPYKAYLHQLGEQKKKMQTALHVPVYLDTRQETPIRNEILLASIQSRLQARRTEAESDYPIMSVAPNQPPVPKGLAWADAENSMPPGGLGLLRNGSRLLLVSYNVPEHRLVVYVNEDGEVDRPPAILGDKIAGHLGQLTLAGRAAFQVLGVRNWEVLGPASEQSGVKLGHIQRVMSGQGPSDRRSSGGIDNIEQGVKQLRPGVIMLIRLQDNTALRLTMSDDELKLQLHRSSHGRANRPGYRALGVGTEPQAPTSTKRIDAFTIDGTATGPHGSESGRPNPKLQLSNGEDLLLGPWLENPNVLTNAGRLFLQAIYSEHAFVAPGRGGLTRVVNSAEEAAIKFGITFGLSKFVEYLKEHVVKDDVFIKGAIAFNAAGAGAASSATIAEAVAFIILAQQALTALKESVAPIVPDGLLEFEQEAAKFTTRVLQGSVEQYLRLFVNLKIQERAGLRHADKPEYVTLLVAAFGMSVFDALSDSMPAPEEWPTPHAMIEFGKQATYLFARAWGAAWSGTDVVFSGRNVAEAAVNRSLTRLWDQLIAPISLHLLKAHGVIGPNADLYARQVAYQREASGLWSALKSAVRNRDLTPLSKLWNDGKLPPNILTEFENALISFDRLSGSGFYSTTNLARQQLKQWFNRFNVVVRNCALIKDALTFSHAHLKNWVARRPGAEDASSQRVRHTLELQKLGAHPTDAKRTEYDRLWNEAIADQDARIGGARSFAKGGALKADEKLPITNSWSEASKDQQKFRAKQAQALQGVHNALQRDDEGKLDVSRTRPGLQHEVVQVVNRDFTFQSRPVSDNSSRVEDHVDPELGTFARALQAAGWKIHLWLRTAPGVSDLRAEPPRITPQPGELTLGKLRPLNNGLLRQIKQAIVAYTVESQFFHYPLRWPVTGDSHYEDLTGSADYQYRVMNRASNIKGKQHSRVDPIQALLVNLGVAHARPFPGAVVRAVVTEASYYEPAQTEKAELLKRAIGEEERGKLTPAERNDRLRLELPTRMFGETTYAKLMRKQLATMASKADSLEEKGESFETAILASEYERLKNEVLKGAIGEAGYERLSPQGRDEQLSEILLQNAIGDDDYRQLMPDDRRERLMDEVLRKVIGESEYGKVAPGKRKERVNDELRKRVIGEAEDKQLSSETEERLENEFLTRVLGEAEYQRLTPQAREEWLQRKDLLFHSEKPGQMKTGGSYAVMTEIFSASASDKVTAHFLPPISGFGASPRPTIQRMHVLQETFVKIADRAELAQAELIGTPGAVFELVHTDANAGKPANGSEYTDIGQVVYLKQIDTYKKMQQYDDCLDYMQKRSQEKPQDGLRVIHPYSGQFFNFLHHLQNGEALYDPGTEESYAHDVHNPRYSDVGLKFISATKNYFLGRPLEFSPSQLALWLYPYTSDSAKRTTGEAINAVLVKAAKGNKDAQDMCSFLDDATRNPHHEYFREKGGYYEKIPTANGEQYRFRRANDEFEHKGKIKVHAKQIVDGLFGSVQLNGTLESADASRHRIDKKSEMLAWLMVSFLSRPIELVSVDDEPGSMNAASTPNGSSLTEEIKITHTFYNLDLMNPTNSLSKKGREPVRIGVGKRGLYAIRHVAGEFRPTHRVEGKDAGKTAENFIQSYLRAAQAVGAGYDFKEVRPPRHAGGKEPLPWPVFSARERLQRDGAKLLQLVHAYARSDFGLLQEAIVKRWLLAELRTTDVSKDGFDDFADKVLGSPLGVIEKWHARSMARRHASEPELAAGPLTILPATQRTLRDDDDAAFSNDESDLVRSSRSFVGAAMGSDVPADDYSGDTDIDSVVGVSFTAQSEAPGIAPEGASPAPSQIASGASEGEASNRLPVLAVSALLEEFRKSVKQDVLSDLDDTILTEAEVAAARQMLSELLQKVPKGPLEDTEADRLAAELNGVRDKLEPLELLPIYEKLADYMVSQDSRKPREAGRKPPNEEVADVLSHLDRVVQTNVPLSGQKAERSLRAQVAQQPKHVSESSAAAKIAERDPLGFASTVPDLWTIIPEEERRELLRKDEIARHGVYVRPGNTEWLDQRHLLRGTQMLEQEYPQLAEKVRLVRPLDAYQIALNKNERLDTLAYRDPDRKSNASVIILPLNNRPYSGGSEGSHHAFVVVDRLAQPPRAYYHDSQQSGLAAVARRLAQERGWEIVQGRTRSQSNGYECGDCVLAGIEAYLQHLTGVERLPENGVDLSQLRTDRKKTQSLLSGRQEM